MIKIVSLDQVVTKVFIFQLIQGVCTLLVLTLINKNINTFLSALFGLIIAITPTIVYAKIMLTKGVDNYVLAYYKHKKAMLIKFFINILGFLLVFLLYKNVNAIALFITYIVTIFAYWTCLLIKSRKKIN